MSERKMTGAERMRLAVGIINNCREGFLDRFSSEELLRMIDCMLASGWDIYPDTWAPRQVEQALTAGTAPKWFDDERTPMFADEQYRITDLDTGEVLFSGSAVDAQAYMGKRDWPRAWELDSEVDIAADEQARRDDERSIAEESARGA